MIRMGLIGAGTMGAMYAQAYSQSPLAEMAAICDLDEAKLAAFADAFGVTGVYTDYGEMLAEEQLDAVTVATPDFHHRDPVLACLESGAAVLCEKPLATTMADCEAIRDAVRGRGGTLMVNYGNRHKRQVYAIRAALGRGELGRVENVFVQLREPIHKTDTLAWLDRTTPTFFLLSHCTDTVMHLIGGAPVEVYAKATYGVLSGRGIDTPDAVVAMLTFDHGTVVTMDANWIMPRGFAPEIDFRIELIGEEGSIYSNLRSDDLMLYSAEARALDYGIGTADPLGRVHGWWLDSVYYFLRCLEDDVRPEPTVEDGLNVTRVLLAIDESARTGLPVNL